MNRHQETEWRRRCAEDDWRERFVEFGLAERFEFLRRDWTSDKGSKVLVRCKTCGAEFYTWGFKEILRGNQLHLLCIECGAASDGNDVWNRSPQCEKAMVYYAHGHSVAETAIKFGVSKDQINNAVKARGITNGKDWKAAGREAGRKRSAEALIKHEAERIEHEKHRAEQSAIRKKRVEARKRLREIEKANKKREKEQEKQRAEDEKSDALFYLLNDKSHICSICGRRFSIAEYMVSAGLKQIQHSPKYCSKECKNKHNHRRSKECKRRRGVRETHRRRARKYGCVYDQSVTLPKLIKRDGLRCAICGEACDKNDHSWSKYSGPMYPSIDHIIPMSKGGGHVWNNVQVAHMICNSEKGDSI